MPVQCDLGTSSVNSSMNSTMNSSMGAMLPQSPQSMGGASPLPNLDRYVCLFVSSLTRDTQSVDNSSLYHYVMEAHSKKINIQYFSLGSRREALYQDLYV